MGVSLIQKHTLYLVYVGQRGIVCLYRYQAFLSSSRGVWMVWTLLIFTWPETKESIWIHYIMNYYHLIVRAMPRLCQGNESFGIIPGHVISVLTLIAFCIKVVNAFLLFKSISTEYLTLSFLSGSLAMNHLEDLSLLEAHTPHHMTFKSAVLVTSLYRSRLLSVSVSI